MEDIIVPETEESTDKIHNKLKILYIKDYLEKYSSENHPVSTIELLDMLKELGLECERKSVYDDIQALKDYGMKIKLVRSPYAGYYVYERKFDNSELQFLFDSIRASGSLARNDSEALVNKLGSFCSEAEMNKLTNRSFVDIKYKPEDNMLLENIEVINDAINKKKVISFMYYRRVIRKLDEGINLKKERYNVSPYGMIVSNDRYYVVGFSEKHKSIGHFRVDKMKDIKIKVRSKAVEFSEVSTFGTDFDVEEYTKSLFNMYSGEICDVILSCHISIIEPMIDRFGNYAVYNPEKKDRFRIEFSGAVSAGLASWILGYADKIEVIQPMKLRKMVTDDITALSKLYKVSIDKEG